jgi:hypothetical protein
MLYTTIFKKIAHVEFAIGRLSATYHIIRVAIAYIRASRGDIHSAVEGGGSLVMVYPPGLIELMPLRLDIGP